MNEGKIWTVVNPNVGVPLFLGGVATISLLIHFAVLSNTTWMAAFFQGGHRGGVAVTPVTAPAITAPAAATPTPAPTPAP